MRPLDWTLKGHFRKRKQLNAPCKYGKSLHITSPNIKSRSSVPTSVNGMQNTPKNKSDTARFSRNKLVIVLILRLWISVNITKRFPITASKNITEYKNIIHVPESIHEDVAVGAVLRDFWTADTTWEIFLWLARSKMFLDVIARFAGTAVMLFNA